MEEILYLKYDGSHTRFTVTLPALQDGVMEGKPIKVRVLGHPNPEVAFSISSLSPERRAVVEGAMQALYDHATEQNSAAVADPHALQRLANDNARALNQIADERRAAEQAKAAAEEAAIVHGAKAEQAKAAAEEARKEREEHEKAMSDAKEQLAKILAEKKKAETEA